MMHSAIGTKTSLFEKLKIFAFPVGSVISQKMMALLARYTPSPIQTLSSSVGKSHQFTLNTLAMDLSGLGNKRVLFKVLLTRLFKTQQVLSLVTDAFEGSSFKVEFTSKTNIYSDGECSFASKTIRIAKEESLTHILSTFIFELCNASNPVLANMTLNQFSSADEYAIAMEHAEYLSYQQHIQLLSLLLKDSDFVNTLEGIGGNPGILQAEILNAFQSFEGYWQAANTLTQHITCTHSEYYRRHFQGFKNQPLIFSERCDLGSLFISNEAKELFKAISQNPQAWAILQQCQKPIVACLAKSTNKHNLQGFKGLNPSEQVCFIRKYVERKSHLTPMQGPKRSLAY
ncbi:MAG: hypothetical protein AB7I18_12720 [Candidatus Berkiella sp.]